MTVTKTIAEMTVGRISVATYKVRGFPGAFMSIHNNAGSSCMFREFPTLDQAAREASAWVLSMVDA